MEGLFQWGMMREMNHRDYSPLIDRFKHSPEVERYTIYRKANFWFNVSLLPLLILVLFLEYRLGENIVICIMSID